MDRELRFVPAGTNRWHVVDDNDHIVGEFRIYEEPPRQPDFADHNVVRLYFQ